MDADTCYHQRLSAGRDAHEFASVRAARGPAGGYFASLGNLILNGELGIGEGKVKQGDKLLKLLNPLDILGTGGNMRDIIAGMRLVCYGKIFLIPDLFKVTADDSLIFFQHE
jgi:hypothetical protein